MGIGASVALIAVGAILAFALDLEIGYIEDIGRIDISMVGWILMIAGAVGMIITVALWNRGRSDRVIHSREVYGNQGPQRSSRIVEERRYH